LSGRLRHANVAQHDLGEAIMNLFDLFGAAQGGAGVDNLARQFGVNASQAQGALEALLPAISMGLAKQAENPATMFEMFGKAMQGPAAQSFDEPVDQAAAKTAGNDLLGSLFGSKEMSRAVAAQASAASGLSETILKSMLPVITSMVIGGITKSMFGGGQAQAAAPSGGGLGDLIGSMMGGGQSGANPLGGLLGQMMGGAQGQNAGGGLGDLLGQMMGGGAKQPGANPMGDLLGSMLGGGQSANAQPAGGGIGDLLGQMMGGGQAQGGANPLGDMLKGMFESGAQAQGQHQQNLQSVFDQFLGGGRAR
jgi:hypothetical protein